MSPCAVATLALPALLVAACDDGAHRGFARRALVPSVRTVGSPGGGVALLDYDGDGDLDIFLPGGTGDDRLLRNDGAGRFSDVTAAAGVTRRARSFAAVAADVDNDGFPDLYVTSIATIFDHRDSDDADSVFYRNRGDGTFEDATDAAGLRFHGSAYHAAFADVDRDGHLDLFVAQSIDYDLLGQGDPTHRARPNHLYRNRGDGTFEDVTDAAGLGTPGLAQAALFVDVDDDGAPDLFVANAFGALALYRNDGAGRFRDATAEGGDATAGCWMGLAAGDFDGDGRVDVFATNDGISAYFEPSLVVGPFQHGGSAFHALLHNDGGGALHEVAATVPLALADRARPTGELGARALPPGVGGWQWLEWGWGATFVDLDDDGREDLYLTGNFDDGYGITPIRADNGGNPGRLLFADGRGGFVERAAALDARNLDDAGNQLQGFAVARGDLDGDGWQDLLLVDRAGPSVPSAVWALFNRGAAGRHHLDVRVRGDGVHDNRDGIGARVRLSAGGRTQVRQIFAGSGCAASESPWPHFGLGGARAVDRVEVFFPSGATRTVEHPAVDRLLDVKE